MPTRPSRFFDAYRFAKGETVSMNNVLRNIGRPLDFAAVSDHAEFLGELLSTRYQMLRATTRRRSSSFAG